MAAWKQMLLLLLLLLWGVPVLAQAQEQPPLETLQVDLWPEFDRPTLLVIYHITLSPQARLPYAMRLRIPTAAGIPNAVAVRQPGGSLISIPYTQEETGSWTWLVFNATMPEVQVEYYDPGLTRTGDARHFKYTWPGDYAVNSFTVEVQQPVSAEQMRITPGMVTAHPGEDGLMYYALNVGPLTLNQPFDISLEYQKRNNDLSANSMAVQPSGPLDSSASGRTDFTSALPMVLGLVGVLLILGGGFWYWRAGQRTFTLHRERPLRHRRTPAAPSETAAEGRGGPIYCHQCGKRALPGDHFCRGCGTQLRIG